MNLKIFLAFAAIYLVWGSTYLAAYFGLGSIPPYLMSGIRFLSAGLILLAWSVYRKYGFPSRKSIRVNGIGGILMLVGGSGSVLWAQQYVASGLAAILLAALPIWFVLLDKKQWSFYFSRRSIILGVVLGFAGIILLFGTNAGGGTIQASALRKALAIAAIIAGSLSWTIGSLFTKYRSEEPEPTVSAVIQLLSAGMFSLLLSPLLDDLSSFSLAAVSARSWLAVAYLVLFGSVIGYMSYIYLLAVKPAAQVGTHAYVNPVIAVILGVVFIGESISAWQLLALTIILLSVLLINRKQ